jgi:hypothetical protein
MVLVIHDEQLARQLQDIAESEKRPVEDVLKSLLTQYTPHAPLSTEVIDAAVERMRRYAYEQARHYWRETGNKERLALTDEELDKQFWLFDSEGIPRLQSEQTHVELVSGSSAWFAENLDNIAFETENPIDPEQADDILKAEFADYLLKRIQDGSAPDSDR